LNPGHFGSNNVSEDGPKNRFEKPRLSSHFSFLN